MIEFPSELQKIHNLDRPSVSHASPPAGTTGPVVDDLALVFNEEVVASRRALAQRELIMPLAAVQMPKQLYEQLGHPAKKTLAMATLQARQQLRRHAGVDELLELSGGDPALTFVVLKQVQTQAGTDAALARDAIIKLEARFAGQIQAGLNTAVALQAASVDPQERQALRMLYYANVVSRQSLVTMLQALLDVYGGERFPEGLKVMQKALADDIAAKVSSMPTALLRTLLRGLQSCVQLNGALKGCHALLHRLGIVDHDAVALMQRLLGFTNGGIGAAEILRLAADLLGRSSAQQMLAIEPIRKVVQQFPSELWLDSRVRDETLNCFLVVSGELHRIIGSRARLPGELEARG